MLYLYSFFGLLFFLFFLSRILIKQISFFLYAFTHSHRITVFIFSLLFLPGTFIHELAHYCMSHLLFVPTGKMTLIPKIEGTNVRLGSVEIGITDPFRRLLIGAAPFLFGIGIILLTLFLFFKEDQHNILLSLLTGYILFEIGNTMFSSKKDMEGALELLIAVLVIGGVLIFLGIRIPHFSLLFLQSSPVVRIFEMGNYFLLFPITLDLIIITVLSFINKLIYKKF